MYEYVYLFKKCKSVFYIIAGIIAKIIDLVAA